MYSANFNFLIYLGQTPRCGEAPFSSPLCSTGKVLKSFSLRRLRNKPSQCQFSALYSLFCSPGPSTSWKRVRWKAGKKYPGPRSLNGRKQKLIGDKPSIVHVLETFGMYEAVFPPGCWNCLWRVLGQVEEASIALLPLHLRCQEGKAWFVRSQTPSGGHL